MVHNSGQYTEHKRHSHWIERGIAIFALLDLVLVLNLVLVFFGLTYLSVRSIYFQVAPSVVQICIFEKH